MSTVKERVERFELNAKKALGQNFILDANMLNKLARMALMGTKARTIVEVGPGPGGLTQALLEQSDLKLIAIEKDARCMDVLQDLKDEFGDRLVLMNEDATQVDEGDLGDGPRILVANLPYNVSTVLLVQWLEQIDRFESLTLMFQKEVADRLRAEVSGKEYGRLSVLTQWLCDVDELVVLPPEVFTPRPKIKSSFVRLSPKKGVLKANFKTMERVLAVAFNQRRKMVRQSLKPLGDAEALCAAAKIDSTKRAENLTVADYVNLANAVEAAK